MNTAGIRGSVVVVAVAAALAGGVGLGSAVSQGARDVAPWTTTHGVGTAMADGTAPTISDLHVTKWVDKSSPNLFVY